MADVKDIKVSFKHQAMAKPIELPGCERVHVEGGRLPAGKLTLVFARRSPGASEMLHRASADEGSDFHGVFTVVEHGTTTEYKGGYMECVPPSFTFTFVTLDT
jgi:hypothetical protein